MNIDAGDLIKRKRGRPAGEPTADVHLLLPVALIQELDARRGDVSRLAFIRRILLDWLQEHQR